MIAVSEYSNEAVSARMFPAAFEDEALKQRSFCNCPAAPIILAHELLAVTGFQANPDSHGGSYNLQPSEC